MPSMETLQVYLRVLYTVNSNPQYILAKSSSQVFATKCLEATAENAHTYARAPLKACLAAVCDSSPELLQDPARDFSLYVLDPLEVQPLPMGLAPAPQNTNSPRGVAVALGLMSWALESNDSQHVFVTGTIISSASPALEVVFALRETKRMPKPFPSFVPVSAPGTPQATGMTWSYTSYPQRDPQERPTLTRSADFPELYIGPPRRARGRPEGSTSSKSKTASQPGDAAISGPSSTRSVSRQETGKKTRTRTKPRPPRGPLAHSPFIRAPLARSTETSEKREMDFAPSVQSHNQLAYPPAQPYSHPTHNPLLGLLSAISATSSGDNSTIATPQQQQATLLSALQGLLANNPQLLQLTATNVGVSASNEEQSVENKPIVEGKANVQDDDGDSDIVILDSSAVDASAFRKRNSIPGDHDTTPFATSTDSPMPSGQTTDSSLVPASTPSSGRENIPSSETSTSTIISGSGTLTLRHVSSKRGNPPISALEMPATPTPDRVRKRKLGEYIHGQVHSSTMSPPSPSLSMARKSGSGRAVGAKPPDPPSPTGETKPSTRLPSMLGSMRAASASSSRLQNGTVSGPSKAEASTSLNDAASHTTTLKRRRTLSEFMAEHEARNSAKARKRSYSGRKLAFSEVGASTVPRSAKVVSTSKLGQSSPPRLLFRSDAVPSLSAATNQPVLMPGAAISNAVLSTTPTTSSAPTSSSTALMKNPLKNFVLPAWARTSTATLPRLSEEALARQQTEREAKKAQISSRRREAAKVKRKQHAADHPSKESSEEDDTAHMPPPPSLAAFPVFASDVVEPIAPSSPPAPPSTPPRNASVFTHRTPGKSGCSLFTPSGQDADLFTPSTPSVVHSVNRVAFTPRTPTVYSGASLRKMPQTPRRSGGHRQTPRSLRGRQALASPSKAAMGTRAFLLPPPSPCAARSPRVEKPAPQGSTSQKLDVKGKGRQEDDMSGCELNNAPLEEGVAAPLAVDEGPEANEPCDVPSNEEPEPEKGYASSPLPPSSPLPTTPFSSPAKHRHDDGHVDTPPDELVVPDSDVLFPTATDSDGPDATILPLLSDDAPGLPTAAWFTDSEAWLTDTENWLTDTEGGPLPTDSDGAWLSDSDAVFGDMSSLPPSTVSNWFSDDADVEDGDGVEELDAAALERAFAAFVEHAGGEVAPLSAKPEAIDTELWDALRPLLGSNAGADDTGNREGQEGKVAQDIQELLGDLAGAGR